MNRLFAALLPALVLAAACSSSEPATGGDPAKPATEPTWEGVTVVQSFATRAFGEISQVKWGRFGAQGTPGLVVAGRSVLLTDAAGDVAWRAEWNPDEEDGAFMGGLAVGLERIDPDGDGIDDLVVVNEYGEVHRLNGADGSHRWSTSVDVGTAVMAQTVVFGADDAPAVLPSQSLKVLDATTGAPRFALPVRGMPVLGRSVRTGPEGSLLLLAMERAGEEDVGDDLFAIDGAGEVVTSRSSGAFVLGLGAADLDGEGRETMLAGLPEGTLLAFDADGTERFRVGYSLGAEADPAFTYVDRIAALDLDGDGAQEVLFTLTEYHHPELTHLVAATGAGQELWRIPLGEIASAIRPYADASGAFAAVAIGVQAFGAPGEVAGVEISMDGASISWREGFPWFVTDLAVGPDGAVVSGAADGRLRRWERSGVQPGTLPLGTFTTAAVAMAGDRTFIGDGVGDYSLYDASGTRQWNRSIELDGIGTSIAAIAAGDPADPTLVAVGLSVYSSGDNGTVQGFTSSGETRFVARHPLAPSAAAAAGDVVAVTYLGELPSSDCRLVGHSLEDGAVMWDLAIPPCVWTSLAAGDVDGDGAEEILMTAFSIDYPPYVALVDSDGTLRWKKQVPEVPMWSGIGPGLVAFGGGMSTDGVVVSLDPATGETRWSRALPSLPDPEDPRKKLTAHSTSGAVAVAPGGEASAGVAAVTDDGRVFYLDASGRIAWNRSIESDRAPMSSRRYTAGPLALAPATDTEPSVILATQVTPYLVRTAALALSLEGEVKASFELEGSVRGVAVGTDGAGRRRVAAATTLGIAAFGAER